MGAVSTICEYMVGSSGFLILFAIPVVLLIGTVYVFKRYGKLCGDYLVPDSPYPFKFPKLSRKKEHIGHKWIVEEKDDNASFSPANGDIHLHGRNLYD